MLPMTPVMLAEYVPPGFRRAAAPVGRRGSEESWPSIAALRPDRISATVRQGGIYHEVIEEAKTI